ncbi:MAG: hypothetical protein K8I27_16660 [Planctomycetes bacterium]|nr:hypothetical protein [Planctomycetota bacterium]
MNYQIAHNRNGKRGTMLVVVLGLLVALFVIGTSFSFITLSERKAAQNYLDRQRALDLALDGVEYSIARLRAEATRNHYEPIGPGTAGLDQAGLDYDPDLYTNHPLDAKDPAVSWARSRSITTNSQTPDGNWIDFNGDNIRGANEAVHGTDLAASALPGTITGFHGDGINVNHTRNENVARVGDGNYGPSGTYMEMGDYFRVRAVDAASLLNLNNYKDDRLADTLLILGDAIDAWLNRGRPTGKQNPFPAVVVQEFMRYAEQTSFFFTSKEQLRPIWNVVEDSDRLYDMAMTFITLNSWVDYNYRDYAEANSTVNEDKSFNPKGLTDQQIYRGGYSNGDQDGRDGWPDWQPSPSSSAKAPININTASKPVLICLFANLEATSRLLFFQKQGLITENETLIKDKFNQDVPIQTSGTTDLGRQNNRNDISGTGIVGEANWYPNGEFNHAIFQLVPIGPITTSLGKSGKTSSQSGDDYATALAEEVIRLRSQHAFTSWQDFDARFCRASLLGINDTNRDNVQVPDLIGAIRGNLQRNPTLVDGSYPKALLPDPANCAHAANPIVSGDSAMTQSDFRAWYWKSCVDMIRAALCPSNLSSRYNADYPLHMNVDRMDLTVTSAPICFSSMGVYEVVSQGEILAPRNEGDARSTSSTPSGQWNLMARRKVRTVVQIYEVMRHTSQRDFESPLDPSVINPMATSSGNTRVVSLASHNRKNTKSGPFSMDEETNGSWENADATETDWLGLLDDAKGIGYDAAIPGQPSPSKDRIKGHNTYSAGSGDFGWVNMNPRDETPFTELQGNTLPLNFHARFNESLIARTASPGFPNVKIDGVNSENTTLDQQWGHRPWETESLFEDFISTATPRHVGKALLKGGASEFQNADEGDHATKYATLMPDGARMTGQNLRSRFKDSNLNITYGRRGLGRVPRIKILRYPCGARSSQRPFEPIRTSSMAGNSDASDGVMDADQLGYLDPGTPTSPGGQDVNLMLQRLIGQSPPYRGTDQHNTGAEYTRQRYSNMPYYEGTVDFWIKWDLPVQGSDVANQVVALGEVDPSSHNFSGLFGCTAYGRFYQPDDSAINDPAGIMRNADADFEGVQFFVYKEPGGWLRFVRLYFTEAFGLDVSTGSTGPTLGTVVPFGTAMRRIYDQVNPLGGYTGTNDIVNDRGIANSNKGFLYARTDAWVDLANAQYDLGTDKRIVLRTHDWHRFTLSYNSNTDKPYRLWLDGRQLSSAVAFFPDNNPALPLGYRNDGSHDPARDQPLPTTYAGEPTFEVYRATTKIMEINPEDRLTVGCIFRRQIDLTQAGWYADYFNNDQDQGDVDKPPRPVFKFDANFVAVANATIDDFRVSNQLLPANTEIDETQFSAFSRYEQAGSGRDLYFEHGFLPVNGDDGLHALPVRLGTISWTELRPDWDPYARKGLTLATSSGIEMEWAVINDYSILEQGLKSGGGKYDFSAAEETGRSGVRNGGGVGTDEYWANGGLTLKGTKLPSGQEVGVFLYRAHFRIGDNIKVNNVTPYLLDVTVTVLTPPRKLSFVIEY